MHSKGFVISTIFSSLKGHMSLPVHGVLPLHFLSHLTRIPETRTFALLLFKMMSVKKAERGPIRRRRGGGRGGLGHLTHQQHPHLGLLLQGQQRLDSFGDEDDPMKGNTS